MSYQRFNPVPRAKDGRQPQISSGYGMRSTGMHSGSDIMYRRSQCGEVSLPTMSKCYEMPSGTPALAYADGQVTISKEIGTGGYTMIRHPDGWTSQYMHLARRNYQVGDQVKGGKPIGIIGYGPEYRLNHKHFQLRDPNGNLVDPAPYLATATVMPYPRSLWLYAGLTVGLLGIGYALWARRTGRPLLPA